jgi:hypothetical protein
MAAGTTQIAVAAAILCRVADAPVRRNDTKRINGATHIPNITNVALVKMPTPPIPPQKKPRTTASRGTTAGAYSRSGRRRVTATSRAKGAV